MTILDQRRVAALVAALALTGAGAANAQQIARKATPREADTPRRAVAPAVPLPALVEPMGGGGATALPLGKYNQEDQDEADERRERQERYARLNALRPAALRSFQRMRLTGFGASVRDLTLATAGALLPTRALTVSLLGFAGPPARPGRLPLVLQASQPDAGAEIVGQPQTGALGVTVSVAEMMAYEEAHPSIPGQEVEQERFEDPDFSNLPLDPNSPSVSQWPPLAPGKDVKPPRHGGRPLNPQIPGVSFDGASKNDASGFPPDTQGAIGPTQFLTAINGRLRIFSKAGVRGSLNISTAAFFNNVITPVGSTYTYSNGSTTTVGSNFVSDPRVRFDRTSNRWFVSMIDVPLDVNGNGLANRVMLGVSSGPTITSATNFTLYQFRFDTIAPTSANDNDNFLDYDTLGVDANAVYIGGNIFSNSGGGLNSTTAFVIRKSSMTSGGPIVVTAFRDLLNGSAGPYTPQGADNDDPSATEGYIIGPNFFALGNLSIHRITNPGGTPALSGNLSLTVPSYYTPNKVPARGSTIPLDGSDTRLINAQVHRMRDTGVATLWTAHTIKVNSSGVGANNGNRDALRWYQIGSLTGTPTLVQSGTLFSNASPAPYFSYGSVAMSGQGHMALGSTVAGNLTGTAPNPSGYAEVAIAGRLATDALGVTEPFVVAQSSSTTYNIGSQNGRYRWGDYSMTSVDPVDDQTIWTIQEYCNGTDSFACRVIQLKAPAPATISSLSPSSLAQGVSGQTVIVTGTSSAGTGFFDTDSTYNQAYNTHLTAVVNGGGVTVNSVAYNSPTQVTLTLSVDANAAPGTRTITLTNPDGQATTSSALLTITANSPTLSGSIALGLVASAAPRTVTFQFRTPGTPTVVFTKTASVDATGSYSLSGLTAGTYDIRLKADQNLAKVVANVTISGGTTTLNATLLGGDANNDNSVDNLDLGLLAAAYATSTGESGFDARADLNGDGSVDNLDLGILANNYAQNGDD